MALISWIYLLEISARFIGDLNPGHAPFGGLGFIGGGVLFCEFFLFSFIFDNGDNNNMKCIFQQQKKIVGLSPQLYDPICLNLHSLFSIFL